MAAVRAALRCVSPSRSRPPPRWFPSFYLRPLSSAGLTGSLARSLALLCSGGPRTQHRGRGLGLAWSLAGIACAIPAGSLGKTEVSVPGEAYLRGFLNTIFPEARCAVPVDPSSSRGKFNFIADAVEKAAPAVVYIEIIGRQPLTGRPTPVSSGSGFIVSPDGVVVTNAHVVASSLRHRDAGGRGPGRGEPAGPAPLRVCLPSGEELGARVLAIDERTDLAALQVHSDKPLPVLALGSSACVRAGEFVVALGSPFSLHNTITAGIVSSVHRGSRELGLESNIDYIQTDAAINFGNSGGPLVNLDGEVIGVNTMKVTAGISFAIPSDTIRQFLTDAQQQAVSPKVPTTGKKYIGITMLTLTPRILTEVRQRDPSFPDVTHGVLIHSVTHNSPAHRAGVRAWDVVVRVGELRAERVEDVFSAVQHSSPAITLTLRRGERTLTLTITPQTAD